MNVINPAIPKYWTAIELRKEIYSHGHKIRKAQFYTWLKFAMIDPEHRNSYTREEVDQLLRFGEIMAQVNNVKLASMVLLAEIKSRYQQQP